MPINSFSPWNYTSIKHINQTYQELLEHANPYSDLFKTKQKKTNFTLIPSLLSMYPFNHNIVYAISKDRKNTRYLQLSTTQRNVSEEQSKQRRCSKAATHDGTSTHFYMVLVTQA